MTSSQAARAYGARAAKVEREFRKTANGLKVSLERFSRERLTAGVYAIPEDISPRTGKKRWHRTHTLLRAEHAEVRDPYTVVLINTTPYALPRHEAGNPGARKINPVRESHWRDEVSATFRSVVLDLQELTVRKILGLKGGV
jgi:hypothetical protein